MAGPPYGPAGASFGATGGSTGKQAAARGWTGGLGTDTPPAPLPVPPLDFGALSTGGAAVSAGAPAAPAAPIAPMDAQLIAGGGAQVADPTGNLPAAQDTSMLAPALPPSAGGVGWSQLTGSDGLNPRLGTRLQRESMNALAAAPGGAY